MITKQQYIDIAKECGFETVDNIVTSDSCGNTWTVCVYHASNSTIEFCYGPCSFLSGFSYGYTSSVVHVNRYTPKKFREDLMKRKIKEKKIIKKYRLRRIEEL